MDRDVVITGIGPITPIGLGKNAYAAALRAGKDGISEITRIEHSDLRFHRAGEIKDFDPLDFMGRDEKKRSDRFSQFALAAAHLAMGDAGLTDFSDKPYAVTMRLGVGLGGLESLEAAAEMIREGRANRVLPYLVPNVMANAAVANVSRRYQIKGQTLALSTACASALTAIGDVYRAIRTGMYDVGIAGGADAMIGRVALVGFGNLTALSPRGISRPFDLERDGFVIGEGAGVIIMESEEHAVRRGARIYAYLAGHGAASDAFHITKPDEQAEGLVQAIGMALRDANMKPLYFTNFPGYINAHGTSTQYNDATETMAFKRVFGEDAPRTPISAVKSMTGHPIGAAGANELIAAIIGMEQRFIPPTINYRTPDPACDLDYVPNAAREGTFDYALKTSLGFGGHNEAVILKRFFGS